MSKLEFLKNVQRFFQAQSGLFPESKMFLQSCALDFTLANTTIICGQQIQQNFGLRCGDDMAYFRVYEF